MLDSNRIHDPSLCDPLRRHTIPQGLRASGMLVWVLSTVACRPDLASVDIGLEDSSTTAEDSDAGPGTRLDESSTAKPEGTSLDGTGSSAGAAFPTDGGLAPSGGAADSSSTTEAAVECGDGVVDGEESCDRLDLGGSTCSDIGYPLGGPLSCHDDCTYDISRCILPAHMGELIFSEYVEGQYPWKALEIANKGATALDLGGCAVSVYFNEDSYPKTTLLEGPVERDGVFVMCTEIVSKTTICDIVVANDWFNGNDTIELQCNGVILDVFGEYGANPGLGWFSNGVGTVDETLRRSCAVTTGDIDGTDPFDPSLEWLSFPTNDITDLGQYVCP